MPYRASETLTRCVRNLVLIIMLAFACASFVAEAALNVGQLAVNFDGKYTTKYPNGDKPVAPSCGALDAPWTLASVGTGTGEICQVTASNFTFNVRGGQQTTDHRFAYRDCGGADCQIEARILDTYAGAPAPAASFVGIGVGIRESTAQSSWFAQCHSPQNAPITVQCQYGANGIYTTIDGAVGHSRPQCVFITHDISSGSIRGFESDSADCESAIVEIFATTRTLLNDLVYVFGTSGSTTQTLAAEQTEILVSTTIDAYTPSDPPPPDPPNNAPVCSAIANQNLTQGVAITPIDVAAACPDPDAGNTITYSATGLSGRGLSISSSTGFITGTPNATALAASPFNVTATATDQAAAADSDTFLVTVAPASGSGDTFTVPDVGDTTDSAFNCATSGGANGASWSSLGGTGTPIAGDTILITSGTRGDTSFSNCRGTKNSPITIKKTASATRLIFNGNNTSAGAGIVQCIDCVGVTFDFLSNWTGRTTGCGANKTATGISKTPLTDCGALIQGSTAYSGFRLKGERRFITVKGIEIDGDWPGPGSAVGMDIGFWTNDQGYCPNAPTPAPTNPNDTSTNWVEGIDLTDSYIHDIEGPATYIGLNITVSCGGARLTLPNLRDIYLARNYFADLGSNGVHIKRVPGSDPLQALVEDSFVARVGGNLAGTAEGANNRSYACYEGSCTIRNSIGEDSVPDDPSGPGFTCGIQHRPASFGTQVCDFYNVVAYDMEGHSFNAVRQASGIEGATSQMEVRYHNATSVNPGGNCVNIANTATAGYVRNILCAGSQTINISGQGTSGNGGGTEASQNFQNAAADDYRLTATSPARNNGVNTNCPSTDLIEVTRPQGIACDRGAFEFDE